MHSGVSSVSGLRMKRNGDAPAAAARFCPAPKPTLVPRDKIEGAEGGAVLVAPALEDGEVSSLEPLSMNDSASRSAIERLPQQRSQQPRQHARRVVGDDRDVDVDAACYDDLPRSRFTSAMKRSTQAEGQRSMDRATVWRSLSS